MPDTAARLIFRGSFPRKRRQKTTEDEPYKKAANGGVLTW
jgi:hypothetical protein